VRDQALGVKPTPTYLLLEAKLGEPLAPLVERMRADERSFPYIARKLRERTNHEVTFSTESLRQWFSEQSVSGAA
jgi:hypothetical protein